MALRTNFFPDGSTVYQSDDFRAPWAALLSAGVFGADDFMVTADSPADLAVCVAAGVAHIDGYIVRNDAPISVPITANTSGYNRIDLIVIDVDATDNVTSIKVVQGVPSSSPVAPVAAAGQLSIAQILVGNNASVINSNVITDMRAYCRIATGDLDGLPRIIAQDDGSTTQHWIKYADGRLEQWGYVVNDVTCLVPQGSIYKYSDFYFSLPVSFVDDKNSAHINLSSTGYAWAINAHIRYQSPGVLHFDILSPSQFTSATIKMDYIVKGRWK